MRLAWFAAGLVVVLLLAPAARAGDGNRLAYLGEACDPYYVGLSTAKLVTPQWAGDEGVELGIVLAIDDMRDPAPYEKFLRPILERLKQIDGRAAVSIMTCHVDPNHAQLETWYREGVNLEAHTYDHPCPCLQGSNFEKAKSTYDRCVDLMALVSGGRAVAFRMPCCDSMNSAGPRFFAEIFNQTTARGHFQVMDSSVFLLLTPSDPALPRELVIADDGQPRFARYLPKDRKFVNFIEDYPYPYVIARLCWEMPTAVPDDWQGIHLQKPQNPITVRDMKAAIDATAAKQGVYTLTFHPHGWIRNDQVIEMIDHAAARYGKKVKVYNFREVYQRLTANVLGGQALRAANGQDNGVRVLDLDNDGYMDAVIGNEHVRQTRLWSPQTKQWLASEFPVELVSIDAEGNRLDAGVRFGVLQRSGFASVLVRNEKTAGLWHFDGRAWQRDPQGLVGLEAGGGPVVTCRAGLDQGVRLHDLDGDGVCELIVANPAQQCVFQWSPQARTWQRLPFTLPGGAVIADERGRDAGCRLVDVDDDGRPDVVFSNAERYLLYRFVSMQEGWSRKVLAGRRSEGNRIPMIVRADGTNNGVWFNRGHMWLQNEDTFEDVQVEGKPLRIPIDYRAYRTLLDGEAKPR